MTSTEWSRQSGLLMSLYIIMIRASELIRQEIMPNFKDTLIPLDREGMMYLRQIIDGTEKVRKGAEYLDKYIMNHGKTKDGKTDYLNLHDALAGDANDFLRFNIDLFNARVCNVDNQEKMENLVSQFTGNNPAIIKEVREQFRLK